MRGKRSVNAVTGAAHDSSSSLDVDIETVRTKKMTKTAPQTSKSDPTKENEMEKNMAQQEEQANSDAWYTIFTKGDEEYNAYMASEWSFEQRGDQNLFELLSLEGAQSGLSWQTILRKREAYRTTYYQFDPARVAEMTKDDVERILAQKDTQNPQNVVVRHRGKIEAVISNARCLVAMQREADSKNALDALLWSFVDDQPILNYFAMSKAKSGDMKTALQEFPSQSIESQAMSKALKKMGWKFVGPTTCYAMMQAAGMVIDHPLNTPEWHQARERLQIRKEGYQDRRQQPPSIPSPKTRKKD